MSLGDLKSEAEKINIAMFKNEQKEITTNSPDEIKLLKAEYTKLLALRAQVNSKISDIYGGILGGLIDDLTGVIDSSNNDPVGLFIRNIQSSLTQILSDTRRNISAITSNVVAHTSNIVPIVNPVINSSSNFKGSDILAVAVKYLGQDYVTPSVDLTDANWSKGFDCSEYASFCVYQTYGIIMGTRPVGRVEGSNAFTGHWRDDVKQRGVMISPEEALRTPGALLLRYPPTNAKGHIAISLGDGDSIYNAKGASYGVVESSGAKNRWDTGILIPGVSYTSNVGGNNYVYRLIGASTSPDANILLIQQALQKLGYLFAENLTALFDVATEQAVIRAQQKFGVVVDGEVGKITGKKLGLEQLWSGAGVLIEAVAVGANVVETNIANVVAPSAHLNPPQAAGNMGIAWGGFVDKKFGSTAFKLKVIEMSQRLGADPNHMMAVMAFETERTFSSDVKNPDNGATGLIQFTRTNAVWLGTSIEELAKMDEIDQLDYVERHMKLLSRNKSLVQLSDVYMTVLYPKAVGREESYVLFKEPSTAYDYNRGLDIDKNGFVTKSDATTKVYEHLNLGLKAGNIG